MICNQDIPEKKCPKVNCRRDDCCGCPFRKVVIPAVAGDDKTGQVIPENGLFTNALVEYEANGALYIYSSDGIFTDITPKQGKPGQSALSLTVGETNTGDPGTNASVINSGTDSNIILDFTIPRGAQGPQGPAGTSPNNSQVNFKDTDANTIGSLTVNQESDSNITIPTASSTRFGMIKARYDSGTSTLYLSTSGEA